MRTVLALVAMSALMALMAGCGTAEVGGPPMATRAHWTLRADTGLSLIDSRCADASCPRYPNPIECDRLEVNVLENGRVCGKCTRAGVTTTECGGEGAGIPYHCAIRTTGAGAGCLVCSDIFNTTVVQDCGGRTATVGYALHAGDGADWTEPPAPTGDTGGDSSVCYDARRGDGSACELCVDGERHLISDDCSGDSVPPLGGDTGMGTTPPPGGLCPPSPILHGRRLFADALNVILAEAGLGTYVPGTTDAEGPGYNVDDIPTDRGLCALGDHFDDEIEEDLTHGMGWWREGQPRCGYMAMHAILRACDQPSTECGGVEHGMTAEYAAASTWLAGEYDCIGSPLVLDLDGDGVRSERTGAQFNLESTGHAAPLAWIPSGDALLARDTNGDGAITTGLELFGELTPLPNRPLAGDGFAALASLDADHDGDVDAADPQWRTLLAWRDDGDGRSEPGELLTLDQAGVQRLFISATSAGAHDDTGSLLGLWGRFQRTSGEYGLACDIFFSTHRN